MTRFTARLVRGAALLLLAVAAVSCNDDDNEEFFLGSPGRISIALTDAAGDIRSAVVTIDRVYLQRSGSDEDSENDNDSDNRVFLSEHPFTTDLVSLANTTADLVRDAAVPGGRYSQLRFVISGAFIEVENDDGTTSIFATSPTYPGLPPGATVAGELLLPTGSAQRGNAVRLPEGRIDVDGNTQSFLVEFDVSRSFGRAPGQPNAWVMTPALAAIPLDQAASLTTLVSLADTVTLPSINGRQLTLADFEAVLHSSAGGEKRVRLGDGNSDGTFDAQFRFIFPGPYTVDLRAPSDSIVFTTNPPGPATVNVVGTTAVQQFIVTSARK